MSRLLFLGSVLLLLAAACRPTAAPETVAVAPEWSADELRALRSFWIGSATLPEDRSNRFADDPGAAELGRRLFFSTALSRDHRFSCAHCHRPELHFTDGLARSEARGTTRRGAPSLLTAGYTSWFYWDGRRDSLWAQALVPIEHPDELGLTRTELIARIAEDPAFHEAYVESFGKLPDLSRAGLELRASPLGSRRERRAWRRLPHETRTEIDHAFANVGKSLAAYQRTLKPSPSRFDRYVESLLASRPRRARRFLDEKERAGLRLFLGDRAQCTRCHNGPMFTNGSFHNIGLPHGDPARPDFGRVEAISEVLEDEFNCLGHHSDAGEDDCAELRFVKKSGVELPGAFKVPSLRNVAETAPYMHDGQFTTLRDVLRHYNDPPPRTIGHQELMPLRLDEAELDSIEAFLRSLTSLP